MRTIIIISLLLMTACVQPGGPGSNKAMDFDKLIDKWDDLDQYKISYTMSGGSIEGMTTESMNMASAMYKHGDDEKYVLQLSMMGETMKMSHLKVDEGEFAISQEGDDDYYDVDEYDEDSEMKLIFDALVAPRLVKESNLVESIGAATVEGRDCSRFTLKTDLKTESYGYDELAIPEHLEVCMDHETGLPLEVISRSYSELLEDYQDDMKWTFAIIRTEVDEKEFELPDENLNSYGSYGRRVPPRCEVWPTGQGLECIEDADALASMNSITFPVRNQHNYAVTGIEFVSATTCQGITVLTDPVPNNQITQLTLTNCSLVQGQRFNEEFTIQYTSGTSGATHSSTGVVGGIAR